MNKNYFSLLIISWLWTSSLWAAPLKCIQNEDIDDVWQVINTRTNQVIGSEKFGFYNEDDCLKTISNSYGNIICAWNGNTLQPTNFNSNTMLGSTNPKAHYRFEDMQSCFDNIRAQRTNSNFCAYNGSGFSIVNRNSNTTLQKYTYNDLSSCLQNIDQQNPSQNASNDLFCSTIDNKSYLKNSQEQTSSFPFYDKKDCQAFIGSTLNTNQQVLDISNQIKSLFRIDFPRESANPPQGIISGQPDERVGFPWKKCEVKSDRFHLTKNSDGYLDKDCIPDVLYSWGNFQKLSWFQSNLKNNQTWPRTFEKSVYTTTSPAATFGYGPVPLRFKIKPRVKYKVLHEDKIYTCDQFVKNDLADESEFLDTVFMRVVIRSELSFVDYIICSPQVIDSWSFGTIKNYDEIIKDYKWIQSKNYYNYETYVKRNGQDYFFDANIDLKYTDFSSEYLFQNLKMLRWIAESGLGGIYYSKSSAQTPSSHYNIQNPIYFNNNESEYLH